MDTTITTTRVNSGDEIAYGQPSQFYSNKELNSIEYDPLSINMKY